MNVDERNTKYDSRNHCNAIIETSTNTLISGFSTTIIPNSVTSIANYAFAYLNNLSMTSIVIPNSVKKIGKSSFRSCLKLTSVEIPNSVESIGDYAFCDCKDLTSITIPNSVKIISEGAFDGCSSLPSITIPKGVTSIGYAPFANCKVLTSVVSEVEEPFSIDNMTFSNISSSCTLTVPYGKRDAYIAKGWTADVFKGGIIEAAPDINMTNTLSITDITAQIGTQIDLPVSLTNTEKIVAAQFDLYLPTGVTCLKVACTDRAPLSSTSASQNNEGVYRIVVSSLSNEVITGTDGVLMNITLNVDASVSTDNYSIRLTNIVFSTREEQPIHPADANATLSIIENLLPTSYQLIYKVDDDIYKTYEVEYGASITPEAAPTKEGYVFSGWSEMPETMPDHDVVVTGKFCSTANRMEIKPKEVCIGRTAVLPVELINDAAVKAFEFEVSLPDGIMLTDCELTTRKGSDHKVYFSQLANGKYKVMSYATPSMPFSGNEGEIVNLILDVSSTMEKGVYNVSIKNIELTSTDVAAIILADVNAQLIVTEILPGDANGDGRVSVTDVVSIVDYITGNPPAQFVADAADANGDGIINIFDVTKTVNIILGFDDEEEMESKAREDAHTSSATLFTSMENGRTDLMLERVDDFIAMQFDVVVPEGTELLDVRLHSVADHAMAFGRTGENRYTVIAYSMSNATFRTTDDALAALLFSDEKAASIENATFVTKDGRCVGMDVANLSTGIATVKGERSSDAVYTLSGQFVGTDTKPLSKSVYIRGGRKIIVK